MKKSSARLNTPFERLWNSIGLKLRSKLIVIFLLSKVIPLIIITAIAWSQILWLGAHLREIAVADSTAALNDSAVRSIERLSTDTARRVADFLYARDGDILYLASVAPDEGAYRGFINSQTGRLVQSGRWQLAEDGASWVQSSPPQEQEQPPSAWAGGVSQNEENNYRDGFHYFEPDSFVYEDVPLYDEITYIDLDGNELVKVASNRSTKQSYPLDAQLKNVSQRENTYVKAETYFQALQTLKPGEIYVSDVIGAHVGTNYIGMYTQDNVAKAAADRGYDIAFDPQAQAFAGRENPNGQRFEGIVRWATPVADENGQVIGYVTFALNHDHIMEFVDHITPMNERYISLPSAFEGNYAFIWDYNCRSIAHPRHHSIAGFDPATGDPQVPWLESSIYEGWQSSGVESWVDYVADIPTFDNQSREKKPAAELTRRGLVGLDGRYLNNAPQCIGWMDLTAEGGSGSFYIFWSGLWKLNTAAAIPYYTGQYAPSEDNGWSRRGFGFVAIGSDIDDFTRPAIETGEKLTAATNQSMTSTSIQLVVTVTLLIALVMLIAVWIASFLSSNITRLIGGIERFRSGERQFRFHAPVKDEFGTLADSFDDMAETIAASVKNPLAITDINLNVLYMNEQALRFYERKLDDVVGTSYAQSGVYPAWSKYDPIRALQEGRESDVYYYEKAGQYLKGSANYFYNREGEKIGYLIETAIVTDMVREQMRLERQRALLDLIFSASPDLIWYKDANEVYQTVNPRFASIIGVAPEDFVGKTTRELMPSHMAAEAEDMDNKVLASSMPLYMDSVVRFADGHTEHLDVVRTPIVNDKGEVIGILGHARDVSARVAMENALLGTQDELRQAVEDANRANEHKGEFLARMSHEIRTPMNAIIGITNIVQKKLSEIHSLELREIDAYMEQIETSSQHLLGLLNDILDISKIEAGKIVLSEETMDLHKLAEVVTGIIKSRCDEKHIAFLTCFDDFSRTTFLSDSLRLRQVLLNLLGNAVKFTPDLGTIEFRVEKVAQEPGRTLARFLVRDSGIGISDEAQATIFKAFEQESTQISRQYGGTGLGLSISQRIINLFGGEIQVKSQLGSGSEFSFELWLKESEDISFAEAQALDASGKFTSKRALLVDDVDINRMIVVSLLEDSGIKIEEAADGRQAADLFAASPENYYDIIFMDVLMPVMDGYEATCAIREMDRADAASVPIIALTANAFKDDIDKAKSFGMNDHIAKPVEMERLVEILFRYAAEDRRDS